MERIVVVGSGGAGKSTVARRIAAATGLPLVHLDSVFWRRGWVPTPTDEWERTVAALVAGDRWILDGNYGGTMRLRLAAADTAVFLDVPRRVCLARVVSRAARHRGRARDDVAPGCPERLTWEFVRWIWSYPRTRRPGVLALLDDFERAGGRRVVLRDDADVEALLGSIERAA